MTKILRNKSNIDLDYPICRPSLDLDFTQEVLDERITFSRGSIGTRVNRNRLIEIVSANQPRFDYDPVTGECKGLLIEESRQNLLTYSEDFSNAIWSKANSSIQTNVITAPDGTTTADKLIDNTTNTQHLIYQTRTGSNETVTFSVFCKAAEKTQVFLQLSNFLNFTAQATYDLSTGTAGIPNSSNADYSNISTSIIPYPNGWYRCILAATKGSVNTNNIPAISVVNRPGTGSAIYSGNGTSGIYIWGAQLETGAFPTSYIPTGASTVTRSADLASMTGTNFSSWYNQSEGTIYLSLVPNYSNAVANRFKRYLSINVSPGSGQDNVIQFISIDATNQIQSALWFNSVFQAGGSTTILPNTSGKVAIAVSPNYVTSAGKGSISDGDRSAILATMNRMDIGGYGGLSFYTSNATHKRITYYPRRLKDNQLVLLTQ